MFKNLLSHRLTRGHDIDAPETTLLRRQIIQEKPVLRQIYHEWYTTLVKAIPDPQYVKGTILEIGSGGGFLREYIGSLITSDVLPIKNIDVILNGNQLPLSTNSLRGIVMVNVFHHLNHVRFFLYEAARCIRPNGTLTMIEPWVTPWSRLVYSRLHHEDFSPDAENWEFHSNGPMSSANGALPWIVFMRDRKKFVKEFTEWQIQEITPFMPFRYLLSGGVSLRSLMPSWIDPILCWVEERLNPFSKYIAMFAVIILKRVDHGG